MRPTQNATSHQELPLQQLIHQLYPKGYTGDRSRFPISQIGFQFEPAGSEGDASLAAGLQGETTHAINGMNMIPISALHSHSVFDITLKVAEGASGMAAGFQYNDALFDRETMERMGRHFVTLLEGIADDAERVISDIPILPSDEAHTVTVAWNSTSRDFSSTSGMCIHQLVEAQVLRSPDAPAVVLGDDVYSYNEMNTRANKLAHYLRFLGVSPESLVPVVMKRCMDLPVVWLAVLKAGGVIMPFDPKYPVERFSAMLEDASANVVIVCRDLLDRLPKGTDGVLVLEDAWDDVSRKGNPKNPVSVNTPGNLAYAIYTSGSTGRPKGVMLEHRSIVNYCSWHVEYYEMVPGDRVLHNAGLAFDASMAETWPTLHVGGAL